MIYLNKLIFTYFTNFISNVLNISKYFNRIDIKLKKLNVKIF